MDGFIKKLISRLEEHKTKAYVTGITSNPYEFGACNAMDSAIKIINQLAEEYKSNVNSDIQEVIDKLEVYTAGRLNTSKVEISVLQLQRYINRLKQIGE